MAIEAQTIKVERSEARDLYRQYKAHVHYAKPIDREIQRTYQLIAQGRVVIRAIESIKAAGLNEQGLPKLAILRAHQQVCHCQLTSRGGAEFSGLSGRGQLNRVLLPDGSFPGAKWNRVQAHAPIIPIHLRPKRGLANYHILWEAEWTPVPPSDPLLLRRIGRADLWLVVAAWDLTEVEKAALAFRMNG